ncbi:tRNA pseudouridine(55) synthase TruB [Xylocopilactobacillus apis]|uniref:tRNA pseudouridine synthase B n=1 Tax=Xylocopilactobacillus apis TaxID=2932183 RepID=A0AAU9CV37_9LACO|nr:tRNA pseudouridine(55) synthase TruB [Xylocopilactobacillus apis]BDR56256.1 tRNA pseudouridine synthase B [Xylocopilactobacillus apis]
MINGIIPVYKEAGKTSFFYVNQIKKIFHQKKVGHTGTLDPMVTGVLPICLGDATKLVPFLMEKHKSYSCTILIGRATETEDLDGKEIAKIKVKDRISDLTIDDILETFKGENEQVPPFFSAVRYHGKHLYEYARENIFIKKPARSFHILSINRTSSVKYHHDFTCEFKFEVVCSKGTYIRTLCTQIGQKLGYPAVMKKLVRTSGGGFNLDQTVKLDQIKANLNVVKSLEEILFDLPKFDLTDSQFLRVRNGAKIKIPVKEDLLVLKYSDRVVAIYEKKGSFFQAKTMFLENIK